MGTKIRNGILGGLVGGIVFGIMMQMMNAPTPDGGSMSMMAMVAMVVGSTSIAVGWLYHLFNSAVIGALFAFFLVRAGLEVVLRQHLGELLDTHDVAGKHADSGHGDVSGSDECEAPATSLSRCST